MMVKGSLAECGVIIKKSLSVRVHKCSCGLEIDRDINAARNILKIALATSQHKKQGSDSTFGDMVALVTVNEPRIPCL
jgi:putative transposase